MRVCLVCVSVCVRERERERERRERNLEFEDRDEIFVVLICRFFGIDSNLSVLFLGREVVDNVTRTLKKHKKQ